jgi:class 3 adenylate cyclase/tetratricopeptide (TPR) repeat protein
MASVGKVHCTKCGAENREGAKFCSECATPFAAKCPKCGAVNASGAKFCDECGVSLSAPSNNSVSALPQVQAREVVGERRHLTVLFCDLVGSTAIAARLDPEEWRETVARYHRAAAAAITRFDGHVAKYLGDGVMAYFGWPAAHDNDAERAARAGLAIIDAISKLNEQSGPARLSARVGIDSGAVVVGASAGHGDDIFGDAPNIAARVQGSAAPDTVAITDATHRLVSGLFVVEDVGAQTLKGLERPLQLYRVIRPSGVRGRFEAATAAGGLTPFVGRGDELCSLMNRWERVFDGEGQVALIIGEAGLGKSRLLQRFHEQIASTPHTWVEAGAGALFQNTPFYPVTEMLRQFLGDEPTEDQLAQLESRLTASGLKTIEAIPLIAPLLNLPLSLEYRPSALSPEQQRRRLLATLVEWVLGSARVQSLVIAIEDLHWVDPSTLELIQLLVEQGATSRLPLLYTARPEFRAPWPLRAHHTQITLNRLGVRDIRTMVEQVAASKALSDETVATVVERTGGVPLFVEELTRAVLESGDSKLTEIPATLHDSLMARLDRLGPAKEVAQVAAVIGREFSYELLHAVQLIGEEDLQRALRSLTDAELLYVRGIAPDATYQFKHALIQEAAYEALLKSRRKELHLIVARTIDEKFSALKEAHPEVLARHWTEAGEIEPATTEWTRAGESAIARGAYREGEQYYRDALAILETSPESPDRDGRELKLQLALGGVMGSTRVWSGVDTASVYARARTLAKRAGSDESLQVFRGLWASALTRGDHRAALIFADQMLEIARGIDEPSALVAAHHAQGFSRLCLGDLTAARPHFLQAVEHYREEDFHGIPDDGGVNTLAWAGFNEWLLGYPDQALRYNDDARALARRLNNPSAVAYAEAVGLFTAGWRGDFARLLTAAKEVERLGTELGLPLFSAGGKFWGAWGRTHLGELSDAVDSMREALAELDAFKFYLHRGYNLSSIAEAQALAGAIDDAIVTVEQAVEANPDELYSRVLALQMRGELRVRNEAGGANRVPLAEQDFREAVEIAQKMSAKSLELRATTSLARLLAHRKAVAIKPARCSPTYITGSPKASTPPI